MPRIRSTPLPQAQPGTLSRLYVDGVPLDNLNALYDANTKALGGQKWNAPTQLWATPPRWSRATERDVFEISLNTVRLVNHFTFLISKFPLRGWLQWYDEKEKTWKDLRFRRQVEMSKRDGVHYRPIQFTHHSSTPHRMFEGVRGNEHRHPHHKSANHWETMTVRTRPVRAKRFRMVLAHLPSNKAPRHPITNKPVKYSLAVKDFQCGYEALTPSDIPLASPAQQVIDSTSFATSTDMLGSPVEFSMIQYRAQDLLYPSLQAQSGVPLSDRTGVNEVWKCEPQPFPWAVVNLYVDARTPEGAAQTVDRFFVNPTTSGVHVNLYYSAGDLDYSGGFEATDDPIRYPGVRPHGAVAPLLSGVNFPEPVAGGSSEPGYLDIDNAIVQLDWSKDWWFGLRFRPGFGSTLAENRTILDTAHLSVRWVASVNGTLPGQWEIAVDGQSVQRFNTSFEADQQLVLVVGKAGSQFTAQMGDGWSSSAALDSSVSTNLDPTLLQQFPDASHLLRLGGALVAQDADPGYGGYILDALVTKQETWTEDIGQEFIDTDAEVYLRPSDVDGEDDYDYTGNAVLRISPLFQTSGATSRSPYGVVGGPALPYDTLVWTPINRDYRLHKGYLEFDPVRAKYFKFEFTNLVSEPYASIEPVTRSVRVFSSATVEAWKRTFKTTGSTTDSGIKVAMDAGSTPQFSDQARLQTIVNPNRSYDTYSPVEALYSPDPAVQERLSALNPMFHLMPKSGSRAPRFTATQRHYYEVVKVRHATKVAFSVGLSELRMFRVDYTAADDAKDYTFPFHDRAFLDDAADTDPWSLGPGGGLDTGGYIPTNGIVTSSEVLSSNRGVRGIQFATVQSDAKQLLIDPDFNDANLSMWESYGMAALEASGDFSSTIGSTVKVTRRDSGGYWDYLEQTYSTWDAIENSVPALTWDDLEAVGPDMQSFGGVQSKKIAEVQPAQEGRLYAAARVYCPTALTSPLRVQIITDSGAVLADQEVTPNPGQVTEWYCSYTIGAAPANANAVAPPTWDQVEADGTWDQIEAIGTWNDITGGSEDGYTGPVRARVYQEGPSSDVFYVDNLSIYEDAIIWEFSNDGGVTWFAAYDIRNNPDGVLLFPSDVGTKVTQNKEPNELRWRVRGFRPGLHVSWLYLRPWYSHLKLGVPFREGLQHGGPNVSVYDQYPSVSDSPPFKNWSGVVPAEWWFVNRQWSIGTQPSPTVLAPPMETNLTDDLIYDPNLSLGATLPEVFIV